MKIIQLLLDKGADIEAKDGNNQTLLQEASKQWDLRKVELLLQEGADVGSKNSEGRTALHLAAKNGHSEGVKLLLSQCDIDPNSIETARNTPLSLAMHNKIGSYGKEADGVVQLLLAHASWDIRGKNRFLWDTISYGK